MQKNKIMRACQVCGKPFYGSSDFYYCPECAKIKKADTVVRLRICQACGAEFLGGPRAKRCTECAYKAQQEANRRHKKTGAKRPLGGIDKCAVCGAEYTVVSSRQKYCSDDCARKALLEWQRGRKSTYNKASGQDIKKQERRNSAQKICVYCLRTFTSDKPTNVCSDYCRTEQKKLRQCINDINRGINRDYDKYIGKRDKYREEVKNNT